MSTSLTDPKSSDRAALRDALATKDQPVSPAALPKLRRLLRALGPALGVVCGAA